MTIRRLHAGSRMSQVVVHGNTVYLAGQVADNPVPSVGEQTRQILARIDPMARLFAGAVEKLVPEASVRVQNLDGSGGTRPS
jgi:enamine deaminase RidA (YjgF/YER057c/UK114 family)